MGGAPHSRQGYRPTRLFYRGRAGAPFDAATWSFLDACSDTACVNGLPRPWLGTTVAPWGHSWRRPMSRRGSLLIGCLWAALAAFPADAAVVQFVPTTDPLGSVFTTNFNDGYQLGRGMVFEMQQDLVLDSIGIFHDLTNISLS